jgi:hypothetical protein
MGSASGNTQLRLGQRLGKVVRSRLPVDGGEAPWSFRNSKPVGEALRPYRTPLSCARSAGSATLSVRSLVMQVSGARKLKENRKLERLHGGAEARRRDAAREGPTLGCSR